MNKQELIDVIAQQAEITKAAAAKALDAFTSTVTKTLQEGGKVAIAGFGNYETSFRPERQGRNPQTGEAMTISAATVVKFKPGKAMKEQVNTAAVEA